MYSVKLKPSDSSQLKKSAPKKTPIEKVLFSNLRSSKRKRKNTTSHDESESPAKTKKTSRSNQSNHESDDDCIIILEDQNINVERTDSPPVELLSDDENSNSSAPVDNSNFPMWQIPEMLSEVTGYPRETCRNVVKLIENENTLPFIARYRRNMVNNMSPEQLQEIFDNYEDICELKKKSLGALHSLKKKNVLTENIQNSIISAKTCAELDLTIAPFKNRSNIAIRAKELELDEIAQSILNGNHFNISEICEAKMQPFKEIQIHLVFSLADAIHKDPNVIDFVKTLKEKSFTTIECTKPRTSKNSKKSNEDKASKFDLYKNFKISSKYIKPHQTLAINRGESMKELSVKVVVPDWCFHQFKRFCKDKWKFQLIDEAIDEAYKRYVIPWMSRQVRSEMTKKAIKESLKMFCLNLKRLLLTAPIKGKNILAIDPGFRHGCKLAVINSSGNLLQHSTIYPNCNKSNNSIAVAENTIKRFLVDYNCSIIALGNGTACRETEQWLRNLKLSKELPIVIVPEDGASDYSCTPQASKEFQNLDPNIISAISLGRRVLDPLSELIKVNPKHIGVGMYQHDVPEKLLNDALNNIVVNCVSFVGVDLNTASETLLSKVAGLTSKRVENILKYRENVKQFTSRDELLKVTGIGRKTYTQCAGFLRVTNSANKLDNTWIHPESYDLTYRVLEQINLNLSEIGTEKFILDLNDRLQKINISSLAALLKCTTGDIELIIELISQLPSHDNLRNVEPIYSSSLNTFNDLYKGAIITGIISNVTTFGVFVDCGLKVSGLIHMSKFNGIEPPQLGQRVKAKVISFTENKLPLELIEIITQ